jgi:2,4-dienoyl-CoA reductase-like NADH-dependent reductase (Old Yellow Enzyme family)
MAEAPYPLLFSPLTLAGHRLRNRIVHASMSTRYVTGGEVTPRLVTYHVNRARGGAAMLVSEPLNMLQRQLNPLKVLVRRDSNRAGLERWAAAVAAEGSLLLGQVQDPGRGRHQPGRSHDAVGASALPDDLSWTVPHALTTGEVEAMLAEFAQSARILRDAGFAGVEVSAGHGHLFHQFLAARSNQRQDRYGGTPEARARILLELVAALRAECGSAFIVGIKLPGDDGMPDGIGLEQSAQLTRLLHQAGGVDYLTYCWGAHSGTLDWHLPDMHGPRAPYAAKIAALGRHAPGVAIGVLGLLTDPNEGERWLREGAAQLVMLGRPLVTDPAWGNKARAGREAQIRYCVSCNTCWGSIVNGSTLVCDNNPRVGTVDEADWQPAPTPQPRCVVVVGAGIAGMEAAWVAARRGHDVQVFSASPDVGGKTRLHALLPGGESLSSIYDYQRLCADRARVRLEFGVHASLGDILAARPDVVVLACGSTPAWPAFLPDEYRGAGIFNDLRATLLQLLARRTAAPAAAQREGGTVVIYDRDHGAFTYAAAQWLAARFSRVVIVSPRQSLAEEEPLVNRQGIVRRLYGSGIEILTLCEPLPADQIDDGVLVVRHIHSGQLTRIEDVVLLTYATPRVPDDRLAAPLRAAGIEVHVIGDCYAPRSVLAATSDGHRVGNLL